MYHQQRHTARASPSLALWKPMGGLVGLSPNVAGVTLAGQGSALPDLGSFKPGNYENNILQDIMVLMSFFWPDPLNSPNKSQWWVNFQWSVPAQSDTADHKAEREMLRQPNGASSSVQTTYMFCFVLLFLERIRKGWQISPEVKENHRGLCLWIKHFQEPARINVFLLSLLSVP